MNQNPSPPVFSEADFHPLNVLLAEDDDDHAYLVRRSLKDQPSIGSLHRVHDGVEAIERLIASINDPSLRPDLILLDLNMPRKSGLEVLKEIKSHQAMRTIPIVMLTTSNQQGDRLAAYDQHVNSYVVKPVDAESFHDVLREIGLYWSHFDTGPVA